MSVAATEDLLQQALAWHAQGDLTRAGQAYEQTLAASPQVAEVWHLLGVLRHQQGQHEAAAELITQAIGLDSLNPFYHGNLGVVRRALRQWDDEIACYRRALELRPEYPEALSNLGHALGAQRQFDEAERLLRRVLLIKPEAADAWFNLGQVCQDQHRLEEAVNLYREALRLRPAYFEAWNNLGVALNRQGRHAEAKSALQRAGELNPQLAEVGYNLAQSFHALGQLSEAVECYSRFLEQRPAYALGHNNLGNALEDLGQVDRAIACYREALRLQPELLEAYNNLGHAYQVHGRLAEARACYQEALRLGPDHPIVRSNWLFFLNYDPDIGQAELLAEHRRWSKQFGRENEAAARHDNDCDPQRILRVGYISPDLRNHAVARFIEPLLAHHDASCVEVFVYDDTAATDETSQRLQSLGATWQRTRALNHDQLAERIRGDRIDVLVDLSGHTASCRLPVFALRPAPVQTTYLGYPNTTGLKAIGYRLTDAVADPPDEPTLVSERLVRLEPCFACYAPPMESADAGPLPASATGTVTFGSLHTLSKLNERVIAVWAEVLQAVPQSRLLLFRDTLNGSAVDYFRERFVRRGVDAARVDLRHELPPGGEHWGVYRAIDISLDPFPWSGHTTSCESIWMGVPVVTLRGDRFAGRMVASMLTALGHSEWIAETPDDYVAIASALASDVSALAELRASLREQMRRSSLCDGRAVARSVENACRTMWGEWCREAPQEQVA